MDRHRSSFVCAAALVAALVFCVPCVAQIGYGVNANNVLFSFDTTNPSVVNTIGPVGFLPEGIDFRPGTATLYAIDIGAVTTQLYTINTATGAATPVGTGFPSVGSVSGTPYNLTVGQTYGFDFNPKTLQPDNSMRIRLVGTSGVNLRLNSSTGAIAAVDGNLLISPSGNSPFVDAVAYINNLPETAGTTALYDMDSRNDKLYQQNPPNNGTLVEVGAFGVDIDANANIGFDVYTDPSDADLSVGGDTGFAVITRPNAPLGGPLGAYMLYHVNLTTGATTNGALVGPAASPFDFTGGFAVLPGAVPEPTCVGLIGIVVMLLAAGRRRSS